MSLSRIKTAIVGFGHIGKLHAATVSAHERFELVAVVEPHSEKRDANFPVPFYNSLDDLLNAKIDIDIICIATPNGLHAQQALQCLNAGKHVVVEKPIALNVEDANKMIETAQEKKLQIFPVMQNRYSPISRWTKELVESGKLGKIYLAQTNCFWNRDEKYYTKDSWHGAQDMDGGTLFTQFVHFLDMVFWLFGDVKNIDAKLFDFNHQHLTEFEDSGLVQFDFVNGGTGTFNYSTSAFQKNIESSLLIMAENGTVKIAGQYMDKVEICLIKDDDDFVKQIEENLLKPASNAENQRSLYNNVANFLEGKPATLITSEEAVKVIDIIRQVYSLRG